MELQFLPLILITGLVLVAAFSLQWNQPTQSNTAQLPETTTQPTVSGPVKAFTFEITHDAGYQQKDSTGASLKELRVKKGDTVKILATSSPPSHKHGVTIDALNLNKEVTVGASSPPQEIIFTASQAGTFEIYCKTCLDGPLGAHTHWPKLNLIVEE